MNIAADNAAFVETVQIRLNQRGETLKVDGHAATFSQAALDRRFPDLSPTSPLATASDSEKHYALSLEYKGVKEQAGPGSNPTIAKMFALAPSWLDQDDSQTSWCGIFRGYIGHRAGTGIPAAHYRAKEWAKWGKAVDVSKPNTWKKGDTIIMTREGGGHVTLLDRVEGSFVWCLGGNQNNEVNISRYAISKVTDVRR